MVVAAIAAISAVGVVVSTILTSSRTSATEGETRGVGEPAPADPLERERGAREGGPNRARVVQLASLTVLVISLVILAILLL